MILPSFISVSLAPGSYFFSALAAVAVIVAATAKAATAIRLRMLTGIVVSPLGALFCGSVASRARACKLGLFRGAKRHCCGSPIIIDVIWHLSYTGAAHLY